MSTRARRTRNGIRPRSPRFTRSLRTVRNCRAYPGQLPAWKRCYLGFQQSSPLSHPRSPK
jgi:hypothetical protein